MGSEDRQEQAPTDEAPPSDIVGSESPPEEMLGEDAPRMSPARFNRIAAVVLVVVAMIVVGAVLLSGGPDGPTGQEPIAKKEESLLLPLCDKLIGEPSAKVKVIALLPVEVACKDQVGLYLAAVAEKHPSMVSVRIADLGSEPGMQVKEEYGIKCATVLINGKSEFDLGPGIRDKFRLQALDMNAPDVRRALVAELDEVYGDSAPELPPLTDGEQHSPH
ncbi:MAG: hypothetical protein QGH74_05120 [Candidatus Brocadiia bacterium]|nr:hypothetical protein [Candidatus Brocadiia bacterium]